MKPAEIEAPSLLHVGTRDAPARHAPVKSRNERRLSSRRSVLDMVESKWTELKGEDKMWPRGGGASRPCS